MKSIQLLLTLLLSCCVINAQDYKKMIIDGNHKVSEIQAAAEAYFKKKGQGRGTGYKSYKRWEYNALRDQTLDGFIRSSDLRVGPHLIPMGFSIPLQNSTCPPSNCLVLSPIQTK